MQKYLAGEREGFSLVELIIVIAIMAILIGVIALAVIPNIQRSRESKDLTTLDNIMSSVNIAIANNKISSAGNFTYTGTAPATIGTDADKVNKAVCDELGAVSLGSSAANGGSIEVEWTVSATGAAKVTVSVKNDGNVVNCSYTNDDNGNAMPMKVESGT
ncbi:MAG: type II secretion system protein [Eubacterium sp.]|nr:type II secretion system protein [Eubacterium sp.]